VDHRGVPFPPSQFKKASPPKMGEAFGSWAGRDVQYGTLPGGSVVQFDLSKLTIHDFRAMRDHYQVNASLSVLSFMLHQSDWTIECEDKKIAEHCRKNMEEIWTQLNRGMSTALWAGYAPCVLQWENDSNGRIVELTKIKDLVPEECAVNWKEIEAWAPPGMVPPKSKVYDGIKQLGARWPIPVENSYWYPMLMEHGDYYGRKLLRPAFQSWFFSILLHLFANRYYERFGEPVPVGRAPFDDEIEIGGKRIKGNSYMLSLLTQLRNRSVVVLPNDTTDLGDGKRAFDYEIEYLESQMRGADFERYMTRLDEEISLGIFTPILLMRTSDVGSYNLGTSHMQLYLWMLNSINGDRKQFIDKYVLGRMVDFNFSPNAPRAKIKFRKMGTNNVEMIRAILQELIRGNKASVDLEELGQMAGMTLKEVKETVQPPTDPNPLDDDGSGDPSDGKETRVDPRVARQGNNKPTKKEPVANAAKLDAVMHSIKERVEPQIANAASTGRWSDLNISMGFKKQFAGAFAEGGREASESFYGFMDAWLADVLPVGFDSADEFMNTFSETLRHQIGAWVGDSN
jgi:hypothetical protein